MLANGDGLAANVLKVPQHGGKTSSTPPFLDAVQPAIAALSVGEANPFGHPSPEAVERILAEGTRLYRTDKGRRHHGNYRRESLGVGSFFTCARPCSELSSSRSPAETPGF
jgi:beta-lactamase superfamily II metal-dependent hydrolase